MPFLAQPHKCETWQAALLDFTSQDPANSFSLPRPHDSPHARVLFPETLAHRDLRLTDMPPSFVPPPAWPDSASHAASRDRRPEPAPSSIGVPAWLLPPAPFADGDSVVWKSESAVAFPELRSAPHNPQ
jgi:hypothetical protein